MTRRKLTPKRQRFVDAYTGEAMGNGAEAARIAGYAHPVKQASRLLTFVDVAAAIAERRAQTTRQAISTAAERQEWLSRVHRGEVDDGESDASLKDRIKALELLGKMQGDFIERQQVEHSGAAVSVTLTYDEARRLAAEGDD